MFLNATRTNISNMPWPQLVETVKALLLVFVFYVTTITMVKISLGIFLSRIVVRKSHKYLIYVVLAISTVFGIATTMVAIFQCGYPRSAEFYIQQREFVLFLKS